LVAFPRGRAGNVPCWMDIDGRPAPISAVGLKLARLDARKFRDPEIRGIQYQRGEFFADKDCEHRLEEWGRRREYCEVEGGYGIAEA
jgi:hypothetical protein